MSRNEIETLAQKWVKAGATIENWYEFCAKVIAQLDNEQIYLFGSFVGKYAQTEQPSLLAQFGIRR